ncbi:MAG: hypothetical protein R2704_09410 [Microthrixaceae bacterium]
MSAQPSPDIGPVLHLESRSFLLIGERGYPHELYPPSVNQARVVRVDLSEPDNEVPSHKTAAIFTHPVVPTAGFYIVDPLVKLGLSTMTVQTRFVGSDATLLMERCAQDVGTAIRFLKERGYERIILLGFSGGASLLCFYQAQAEDFTITHLPDGRPSLVTPEQLPPADKLVLFGHHLGRSQTLRNVLDAAIVDEGDPLRRDPDLDVFDPRHGPPFSDEFIARIRAGQAARMERITGWVRDRLATLEGLHGPNADEAFVVHRTNADPFMFAETSDFGGDVDKIREVNEAGNGLGRFSSLRSWLSQWATDVSQANGPTDVARTTIPVLSIRQAGDHRAHPDYLRQWEDALGDRFTGHHTFDATHYMDPKAQAQMVTELAQLIHDFAMD